MKNSELFNELSDELEQALDDTLTILVDKGISAGLLCIKEATPEDVESEGQAVESMRVKVNLIVFLSKELKLEDQSWLLAASDRFCELGNEASLKLTKSLTYYYSKMEEGIVALRSSNETRTDVIDVIDDPKYNELVEEAMVAFNKLFFILRFMVSRVRQMNERFYD